ncbi:MAG: hypothetical protein EOP11_07200 [Proteobacteria bacterium]|nr:MAG: hypothetical protein EOP11_07200 [Pseudomonadota bacterium]
MLKQIFTSLLLLPPLFSAPAFAADWGWQHISLHSPGGAQIQINYRVACERTPNGQKLTVPELWVEADQVGISQIMSPRVVFLTKERSSGRLLASKVFDLTYRGANHAASPYPENYPFNITGTSEELALVLGGEWQKDSENGSGNFKFSLFDVINDPSELPCD